MRDTVVGAGALRDRGSRPQPLVLIAEGETQTRRFLRCVLEARGYRIAEACTTETATGLARSEGAAAVLMSLDALGPEAARDLREHTTAVILVMAWPDDHLVLARALEEGADDYLLKPFTARDLVARLGLLLTRRDAPRLAHERGSPGGGCDDRDR